MNRTEEMGIGTNLLSLQEYHVENVRKEKISSVILEAIEACK